jgi:hypothetical protein
MTMKRAILALTLVLAGCAGARRPLVVAAERAAPDWHAIATDDDQQRLRGWRDAWISASDAVRAAGEGAQLDGDAALFDPDRALDQPVPPAGAYLCRWFKLGSAAKGVAAFTAYPAEPCRVKTVGSAARLQLTGGPQRPHGLIFPDEPTRGVFLGTLELGDERRALEYGRDEQRDMAGFVERIGDRRWRLILPQPHFESLFDVIEISPAA